MNSSPKRIFYLITDLDIGGAEKMLFELVQRIDRSKFAPEIGCLKGEGILGRRLEALGIKVKHHREPDLRRHKYRWIGHKQIDLRGPVRQGHFGGHQVRSLTGRPTIEPCSGPLRWCTAGRSKAHVSRSPATSPPDPP